MLRRWFILVATMAVVLIASAQILTSVSMASPGAAITGITAAVGTSPAGITDPGFGS